MTQTFSDPHSASTRRTLPSEAVRQQAFARYAGADPLRVIPALRGRYSSEYSGRGMVFPTSIVQLSEQFGTQLTRYVKLGRALQDSLVKLNGMDKDGRITNFDYGYVELKTAIPLEADARIFIVTIGIHSRTELDFANPVKLAAGQPGCHYSAKLIVSTAKETDEDAQRVASFYNRIGVTAFVALEEQDPARRKRGHFREQMEEEIQGLKGQVQVLTELVEAKNKEIEALDGQVDSLRVDSQHKDKRNGALEKQIHESKLGLSEVLMILKAASMGNRGDAIKKAITLLELQEKENELAILRKRTP